MAEVVRSTRSREVEGGLSHASHEPHNLANCDGSIRTGMVNRTADKE